MFSRNTFWHVSIGMVYFNYGVTFVTYLLLNNVDKEISGVHYPELASHTYSGQIFGVGNE
jgi:hypothetical protein